MDRVLISDGLMFIKGVVTGAGIVSVGVLLIIYLTLHLGIKRREK